MAYLSSPTKITAQVAVESVISAPGVFDKETVEAIIEVGTNEGVAEMYMEMIREVLKEMN